MGRLGKKKKRRMKKMLISAFLGSIVVFIILFSAFLFYIAVIYNNKVPVFSIQRFSDYALTDNKISFITEIETKPEENLNVEEEPPKEDPLPFMCYSEPEFKTIGPSSIELAWIRSEDTGYIIKYRAKDYSEKHGKKSTENGSMAMGEICTCFFKSDDFDE